MTTPAVLHEDYSPTILDHTLSTTNEGALPTSQHQQRFQPSVCMEESSEHSSCSGTNEEDFYETIFDDPASDFVIVPSDMTTSDDGDDNSNNEVHRKKNHKAEAVDALPVADGQAVTGTDTQRQQRGMIRSVVSGASWLSGAIRHGVSHTTRASWEWLTETSEESLDQQILGGSVVPLTTSENDIVLPQGETSPMAGARQRQPDVVARATIRASAQDSLSASTTRATPAISYDDLLSSSSLYSSSLHDVAIATAIARTVRSGGNHFMQRTKYQTRRMVRAGGSVLKTAGRKLVGLESKYNVFGTASLFVLEVLQPLRSEQQIAEEAAIELTS